MTETETWKEMFLKEKEEALEKFFTFLSFPSISSEKENKNEVISCAAWLKKEIEKIGFSVEKWETPGFPVLFASDIEAGPDKPTLLLYNHYDVQPVDPIDEWESDPFSPVMKNGNVYARGAQDNKGQCSYVLEALTLWRKKHGKFPINIKWLIEGEEEIGSPGLHKILSSKEKELKADVLAIVDSGISLPDFPVLTLGIRGIITMDVVIKEAIFDLHSGGVGGMVQNPNHILASIIASLHDSSGQVTVPGFYDDVVLLTDEEKEQLDFQFDEKKFIKIFGISPLGGEKNFSPLERAWTRPTLEVNGMAGGYFGNGFKTVIPAKALAKISCRLVPNQKPEKIASLVKNHLESLCPRGVGIEIKIHEGAGFPVRANPDSIGTKAFANAYECVFQKPCQFILAGGSIPITTELAKTSQTEVVIMGLGLDSDQIHSPNEHFGMDRFEKGVLVILHAIESLSNMKD